MILIFSNSIFRTAAERAVKYYASSFVNFGPEVDVSDERKETLQRLKNGPILPVLLIIHVIGFAMSAATAYYGFIADMKFLSIQFAIPTAILTFESVAYLIHYYDARRMFVNDRDRLYSLLVSNSVLNQTEIETLNRGITSE